MLPIDLGGNVIILPGVCEAAGGADGALTGGDAIGLAAIGETVYGINEIVSAAAAKAAMTACIQLVRVLRKACRLRRDYF